MPCARRQHSERNRGLFRLSGAFSQNLFSADSADYTITMFGFDFRQGQVVNPAQVCAFAQALGKRAKNDPIDAAVIAHFAEATKPKLRHMPDEMTRYLAGLVARRRQIVEMIAAEGRRRACRG
jgi:hypothetical protein